MNFWQVFNTYFPAVLTGAVAVENALTSSPGATKSEVLVNAVMAAAKVGEQVQQPQVQMISTLVDITVGLLNSSGVFTHKDKVEVPATK